MASCPTTPVLLRNTWLKSRQECSCKALATPFKRKNARGAGVQCSATADGEVVGVLDGYLARGFGWGVRRMASVGDEMRRVAEVQAEAFHEPLALFDTFFFEFFKAEVLSALLYRIKNSPPDRRKKVATVLLKACDVLSRRWGYDYSALRAYEDDSAAQRLYTKAGYRVVSVDPHWITWIGKKRRVLMIKHFDEATSSDC